MALLSRKKKTPPKPTESSEELDDELVPEVADESSVELKSEALAPKAKGGRGIIKGAVSVVVITLIAAGGGIALGMNNAANLKQALHAAVASAPTTPAATPKISADTVVKAIDPVITNLGSPMDTWVRLETAIVFKTGGLANPDVTAAEIRQDEVAYLRTIDITQLEGPSALQHLREDLNERASLRSGGKVSELIIETLIVQ